MYEVVFDIANISPTGLLVNYIFFPLLILIFAIAISIAWKLRRTNKLVTFILTAFVLVNFYLSINYWVQRNNLISVLNSDKTQVTEGLITNLRDQGKRTLFKINNIDFEVSGSGVITPAMNSRSTIKKLNSEKAFVRLTSFKGQILRLEKKP